MKKNKKVKEETKNEPYKMNNGWWSNGDWVSPKERRRRDQQFMDILSGKITSVDQLIF